MNSILRSLWTLTAALALFAPANIRAGEPAKIVSAEPTAFAEVTAKLDAGGSLYGFFSTSQWLSRLSTSVQQIEDFVLQLPDVKGPDRAQAEQVFTLVKNLVQHSGVESIAGVGMSGIAIEPGFYRTRLVVQRAKGAGPGYLWDLCGAQPHALTGLDWLPADTVWAANVDLDAPGAWNALVNEAKAAGLAPLSAALAQVSEQVKAATGRSLEDQLGSLGGELGFALVLDSTRKFTLPIPVPSGTPPEFPVPSLLISLKVKDDQLFNWLDTALGQNPGSTHGEAEGARWRSFNVPGAVPFPLSPTVARVGDLLWIASSDEIFQQALKVHAGQAPGLKGTPEFKHLASNLPTEGNSFAFVSRRFTETLWQVQSLALGMSAGAAGGNAAPAELMQKLLGSGAGPAAFSVSRHDADGWQSVGQGTQDPGTTIVAAAVVAPTAVMAGMLLPALANAKEKAQAISCMNNMKQIGLGFRIYATDNNGVFPKDYLSITNELVTPRILFCPADRGTPNVATLTWANFNPGNSSYEFLKPGIKETEAPGTVVARCRVHGTELRLDGSVLRKPTR